MRLYRLFPWRRGARRKAAGHPLFVPRDRQGTGRIDNPDAYAALYAATSRQAAIGASLARYPIWSPALVEVPHLPGARRGIASIHLARDDVVDLDDPDELLVRALRPSRVVTPDRAITQAWAKAIFDEGGPPGVRWWSELDARWTIVGLWELDSIRVAGVQPLRMDDPDVAAAALQLGRRILP